MMRSFLLLLMMPLGLFGTTILPNDPSVVRGLSPANWYAHGADFLQTICPGAYVKAGFSGTSLAVSVDVGALVAAGAPAKDFPWISWTIDHGPAQKLQLNAQGGALPLASGLAAGSHTFQLNVLALDGVNLDRWDGISSVKITGFAVDDGAAFVPAPLAAGGTCVVLGDSVPEGAWDLTLPDGNTSDFSNYSDDESSTGSVAAILGRYLNCEYGQCCHGGIGLTVPSGGGVPPIPSSYLFQMNGVSRNLGSPTYVLLLNVGSNDLTLPAATVTSFLTSLRNTVGPAARIVEVIPFLGFHEAEITAGFNAFLAANPRDNAQLIDLREPAAGVIQRSTSDTSYHLHPDLAGHAALADLIEPFLPSPPAPAGATPGNLINLSVLTDIGSGLTMGFVSGGAAGASPPETVLLRGTGPALAAAPFHLSGILPDPVLTLYSGSSPVASNSGWSANETAIDNADALTGAFPLTDAGSHDAALLAGVSV